jgi:hypothetical protein
MRYQLTELDGTDLATIEAALLLLREQAKTELDELTLTRAIDLQMRVRDARREQTPGPCLACAGVAEPNMHSYDAIYCLVPVPF